jgi:hypothetical protein
MHISDYALNTISSGTIQHVTLVAKKKLGRLQARLLGNATKLHRAEASRPTSFSCVVPVVATSHCYELHRIARRNHGTEAASDIF